MEQLMLQGNRFSLTIQRKAVKHLILRLKSDSELTVSAPYFCSRRDIDQFILSREAWIIQRAQRLRQQRQIQRLSAVGQTVTIYGRARRLETDGTLKRSRMDAERLILAVKSQDAAALQQAFDRFARQSLQQEVQRLRPRWDDVLMKAGLPLPVFRFRRMSSRWGSCVVNRQKITLNLKLIHYPSACLDAVLWHEYAHFLVQDHSARFYALIHEAMPDYDARKALLDGKM